MNKGGKTDLEELNQLQDEFRCFLRPIIEETNGGWEFIASHISAKNDKAIYPKILKKRRFLDDQKINQKKRRDNFLTSGKAADNDSVSRINLLKQKTMMLEQASDDLTPTQDCTQDSLYMQ